MSQLGSKNIDVALRVFDQLKDPRLGSLAGKLKPNDLLRFIRDPKVSKILDNRSGNINHIKNIDGRLMRVTTPKNSEKIISVGRIRENQVRNLINKGDFTKLR